MIMVIMMVVIKLLINWLYRGLSVTHHGNAYKTARQYNHNTKKIPKGCLKPSWAEPHMTHACGVASSTFISAAHWPRAGNGVQVGVFSNSMGASLYKGFLKWGYS